MKNQMGQTVLQKKSGFTSQVSTSVFLLTAKELGIGTKGYYAYPDNSSRALPTAKQILNSETSYCWTRSRLNDGSVDGLSGDDATRAEHGVVCCSYRGSSASVWANNGNVFARPAFTLPANLEVDANGNLMI